jgi:hypothetical protein
MSEWISVKERLPEQNGPYLVLRIEKPYPTARLWEDGHWMSSAVAVEKLSTYQLISMSSVWQFELFGSIV